jgi:vancomycin resistance protein VanW
MLGGDGARLGFIYRGLLCKGASCVIGAVRRALRRNIPEPIRLQIALARRRAGDRALGKSRLIAKKTGASADFASWSKVVSVAQPIRRSDFWEGKLANLRLAAERLNGAIVVPGNIFSFWALVGAPDAANGFQIGRSIRSDAVSADVGGGLCQLSGLAYELGLRSGMDVAERHPHSQDLYTEATRFTPLGLDATVVWGYKDLRLKSNLRSPIAFSFEVSPDLAVGTALSPTEFQSAALETVKIDEADRCLVRTFRTGPAGVRELISSDTYLFPGHV